MQIFIKIILEIFSDLKKHMNRYRMTAMSQKGVYFGY